MGVAKLQSEVPKVRNSCSIAYVDCRLYSEVMQEDLWISEHVTHLKIPHDIFASHKVLGGLDLIMCARL